MGPNFQSNYYEFSKSLIYLRNTWITKIPMNIQLCAYNHNNNNQINAVNAEDASF